MKESELENKIKALKMKESELENKIKALKSDFKLELEEVNKEEI
jgi:chaperonin cofactor prefoldin